MKSYHVTASLWLLALCLAPFPPYWSSGLFFLIAAGCMAVDVETMPLKLRLPLWDIPVWLTYGAVALVLDIIGLVILLPLSALHAWRWDFSRVYREDGSPLAPADVGRTGRHVSLWRGGWLTWLWGNEEDGVTGPKWWQEKTLRNKRGLLRLSWWRVALSAYRWSALRNPSNNLRFVPGINPVIEPSRVQFRGNWLTRRGPIFGCLIQYWLTWQGPYAGLRLDFYKGERQGRFWLGWKLKPEDAQGILSTDMRAPRCGFAMQFKRIA